MKLEYFSNILHESIDEANPSYKLTTFPPSNDFPMATDLSGKVISRYGDDYYDHSITCGRPVLISIANGTRHKYPISRKNQDVLRVFAAYMQFGDLGNLSPRTMKNHVDCLRQILYFCQLKFVEVQDLQRYPLVQHELVKWFSDKSPSRMKVFKSVFREINDGRQMLGFNIFDSEELARFELYINDEHETVQTAYIPLRVWNYQLGRLSYFLQRYLDHQSVFEQMFEEFLAAYLTNCGSIEAATRSGALGNKSPFKKSKRKNIVYLGTFSKYAEKMEVLDVISELIYAQPSGEISVKAGAKPFGRYLNALCFIGQIFLINFSGVRVSEAAGLRSNAFFKDIIGGETVYFLKGATKKTLRDDNALWVTSPVAEMAVRVMTSIAKMRMKVASLDSRINMSPEEIDNPYLFVYGIEPWLPSKIDISERPVSIRAWMSYGQWRERCAGLFDEKCIAITPEDLNKALLATPNLDPEKYAVGQPWPFAHHQLRRTLYVNACRSGLVTEYSGQWQLKHYYLGMSSYYGRNYSSLELNQGVGDEFLIELHKQLACTALELKSENYISLISEKHKQSVLNFLQDDEVKKLLKLVKEGKFSFRRNLLGLCFSTSPCQYGGFDNIVNCAVCKEGLVDKRNLSKLERFIKIVAFELEHELADTPRFESLQSQHKVATNAIEAITIG